MHMGMHIEHGTKIKADKIADKMLTKDADNRRATSTTEQQWLYPAIELRHWPWASCGIWRGDDICKMKVEGVGCASVGRWRAGGAAATATATGMRMARRRVWRRLRTRHGCGRGL